MSEHEIHEHTDVAERIRRIDVSAPPELHERIAAMVADSGRRRRPGLLPLRPAVAGVALALAIAIALVAALVPGGGGTASQPPLLRAAARIALSGPAGPAPREDPRGAARLLADVEGVAFPYWKRSLGWHSTGSRGGIVGGRPVLSVYYADASGHHVGYAILGGLPAPQARGGHVEWERDVPYRLLSLDGARAVAWERHGRLCVIAGRGVSDGTLLRLATWDEHPAGSAA